MIRRRTNRVTITACAALLLVSAAGSSSAQAPASRVRGTVLTDTLWSQSLGTSKALTIYLPPSYVVSTARRYPVLYYLHGLSGNERNWVEQGRIAATLDSVFAAGHPEAVVIMPDGDDSWYTTWNSLPDLAGCRADTRRTEPAAAFCVPWPHYDDYVARDIVAFIDTRYRTIPEGRRRGIAGLSMGGLGAVSLALAYPEVFAAAASHSGILSPRFLGPKPFVPPARYAATTAELETAAQGLWRYMWPAFGRDTIGWAAREPRRLIADVVARRRENPAALVPRLRFDSGTDDRLAIEQNRDFHQTLLTLGVSHEYAEWPGGHSWDYWRTHVAESVVFLLGVVGTP